jgi:hypothetical protein
LSQSDVQSAETAENLKLRSELAAVKVKLAQMELENVDLAEYAKTEALRRDEAESAAHLAAAAAELSAQAAIDAAGADAVGPRRVQKRRAVTASGKLFRMRGAR